MASAYQPRCDQPEPDDEIITCWCGASGVYEDLFDDDGTDSFCGGGGTLNCYCGGDFCVCHHHGETECPGCDDCGRDRDDGFEDDGCDQDPGY